MNKVVAFQTFGPPEPRRTTQGAQDWPRLHWTLDDFDRLTELGVFGEMDHIELIRGEFVPMSPKGNRHERVRHELTKWLNKRLPELAELSIELGWRPNAQTYLEPDILIFRTGCEVPEVPPGHVLLLIEVAHSSLAWDLGPRAVEFARLGVQCYWVVNAATLDVRSYETPMPDGYQLVSDHRPDELVTPPLIPELALRMADLGIDG